MIGSAILGVIIEFLAYRPPVTPTLYLKIHLAIGVSFAWSMDGFYLAGASHTCLPQAIQTVRYDWVLISPMGELPVDSTSRFNCFDDSLQLIAKNQDGCTVSVDSDAAHVDGD